MTEPRPTSGAVALRYRPLAIPAPQKRAGVASGLSTDGNWYFSGAPSAAQGWKLYVSATLGNFLDVLAQVVPVLEHHDVPYKYVASDKVLRKQNAGLYGYHQVGKLIVAYLGENPAPDALIAELKVALEAFRWRAPTVPFAAPLGGGLPLSYRFGAYVGDTITLDGETVVDDRFRPPETLVEWIGDPFAPMCEPPEDTRAFNHFLLRYPIFETLGQGGKGGVFGAFDSAAEEFSDLVLKIGYRNGQQLPDGRDGMALLATEAHFFGMLGERGCSDVAPALVDFVDFGHRNVLVMKRIAGDNLLVARETGKLRMRHIDAALAIIGRVHREGLYIGDAKLANFIVDAEDRVYAIDFECGGETTSHRFDLLRTFHFTRPPISDARDLDLIHFLYSALHREPVDSFSESDRLIDLPLFLDRFEAENAIEKGVLGRLRHHMDTL